MLHGRKLEVAWLFFCSVYVSTRSVIFAILISKCLHQCLLSIFGQLGRNLWKLGTNETCLVKQYKRLRKASLFCNSCLEKKLNINLRCIFLLICFFSWVDPDKFTWMPNFFVLMVLMFVWLIYVFFFSSFFWEGEGLLVLFCLKAHGYKSAWWCLGPAWLKSVEILSLKSVDIRVRSEQRKHIFDFHVSVFEYKW